MPTTSRFPGGRGFLASWYRTLYPDTDPLTVDRMTPTMVAAVLRLDEIAAVRPVPFEPLTPEPRPAPAGPSRAPRIRRLR